MKGLWILGLAGLILLSGCKEGPKEKNVNQEQAQKIVIYQVFTRLFGNTNTNNKPWGTLEENGVGKFNDFSPEDKYKSYTFAGA